MQIRCHLDKIETISNNQSVKDYLAIIFSDLSKAFDNVYHSILL